MGGFNFDKEQIGLNLLKSEIQELERKPSTIEYYSVNDYDEAEFKYNSYL